MKKFYLSLLTVSLLISSVFAMDDNSNSAINTIIEEVASLEADGGVNNNLANFIEGFDKEEVVEVVKNNSLVTMVKNAVQSAAERVSAFVNATTSTAKTKTKPFIAAAKAQKDALVIKAQAQKEIIAQHINNALISVRFYGNFVYYEPKIAAQIAKQFVLKNKTAVAGSVIAGVAVYKLVRAAGPLAQNKKDGYIKSTVKVTSAAALTAAASVFALNKFVTIKA